MRVHSVAIGESPRTAGWARLSATVEYETGSPRSETYWLDVPSEHEGALWRGGEPWLAWLAPVAITLGERLQIDAPVSETSIANVRRLLSVWAEWHPGLRPVSVEAPTRPDERPSGGGRTLSFFSGGVDSFHTALAHLTAEARATDAIDALVFVWGLDIPIDNAPAWANALRANEEAARALSVRLIPVATNLRRTRFDAANWTFLSHGPALGGVALALGGEFGRALIPSSSVGDSPRPWGSHPLTDALLGSDRVRIVNDSPIPRTDKTECVARSPIARRHLRVCYRSDDGRNCGRCKRCYRTMLALDVLGVLDQCPAFPSGALDLARAERIYCPTESDARQLGMVRTLALRERRMDVVGVLDRARQRSVRRARVIARVRALRDTPVLWRWAPAWERRLLHGWVL